MKLRIRDIASGEVESEVDSLCRILADSVETGAAVSFMFPVSECAAKRFWLEDVRHEVSAGRRLLFGAEIDGHLVGTTQLILAMPPNQPHRGEIAKMIVHPSARRRGVARSLMLHVLDRAKERGKTLITLDTRTGDSAERLYRALGFETAGVIPRFAQDPDGRAAHAATFMYREI